ncbi:MAG: putative pyridoxine 5'-phosphate oxidase superfamily flavin-nucleotide-binding protein [Myxococcota bacterium]
MLQAHIGAVERVAGFANRLIRDHMPDQHRRFFAQLPFVVVATVDGGGNPWASLLTGDPGFASSPEPRSLHLKATPHPEDPIGAGLRDGDAVGLLGIELETRRRNRMNGHAHPTDDGISVTVEHSFGNCPKYIHRRQVRRLPASQHAPAPAEHAETLTEAARTWIARADTFYVGSYVDLSGGRQVDVSHRGGQPGFVNVDADGVLTIPDFAGNRLFNTLGNFQANPRGALLFVDFQTGDTLQLTGTVALILEGPQIAAFEGAQRLWQFHTTGLIHRRGAIDLRASLIR